MEVKIICDPSSSTQQRVISTRGYHRTPCLRRARLPAYATCLPPHERRCEMERVDDLPELKCPVKPKVTFNIIKEMILKTSMFDGFNFNR